MSVNPTSPDPIPENIDYFVEWRPWLWRRPVIDALRFLGGLRGKRVLEIGGRSGRMTSLLALQGAHVTMLERSGTDKAAAEVARWNVRDRVRLVKTDGGLEALGNETFDVIFTKSVLWSVEHLEPFLEELDSHLVPGGKAAFLENYRGGPFWMCLRRTFIHRGRFGYERHYFGITPVQLDLFRQRFDGVRVHRRLWMVYEIFGHKRPRNDQ